MDFLDAGYLTAVTLAGAVARAVLRGLPDNWRLRLQAEGPADPGGPWLWLHAVSVGELMLAEGILARLRDDGHRIHLTTGTSAGLELLQRRLPAWDAGSGRVSGGGFPLDDPAGLAPFLRRPPAAYISLETEIWPNLLRELERRGIPRIIVNGRLTERSLERGGPWMARAASRLSLVAARDPASLAAFRRLGAPNVVLGGNLKADLPEPRPLGPAWAPLREAWSGFPVLVAGNTVPGEEDLILRAWAAARINHPGLKLILAPRQPRRFPEVAALLAGKALPCQRASGAWPGTAAAWAGLDILLLDTLGELASAYREGTLALVGGGWAWDGGHNPLEPVRWGVPTLLGPGYRNFQDLVGPLLAAGLVQVVDAESLDARVAAALEAGPLRPGPGPVRFPEELTGALGKTCDFLNNVLPVPR